MTIRRSTKPQQESRPVMAFLGVLCVLAGSAAVLWVIGVIPW